MVLWYGCNHHNHHQNELLNEHQPSLNVGGPVPKPWPTKWTSYSRGLQSWVVVGVYPKVCMKTEESTDKFIGGVYPEICWGCLPKSVVWSVYLNICLRCLTKSLHGVSTQIFAWGVHPKVCNGVSIMRSEAGTFIAGTQHNSSLPRAVASYRCLKQLYKCRSCCLFYLSFFNFFVVSLMLFCFFSNVHSAFLYFLFSCFSRFSCTAVLLT